MISAIRKHSLFLETIGATIAEHKMLSPGDRVLIGVSGGPDSVSLLLALLALKKEYSLSLAIAHINHQLRGEDARADEAFVRRLAQDHSLPCHCTTINIKALSEQQKLSVEEAGRNARYTFFKQLCDGHGFTKVATGHTKDDNAELILMNLLRGSGPKGLTGIPPMRNNLFIRPLIQVSKQEITRFLEKIKQPFRTDASNTDTHFLRNRIRCDLIPKLQKDYNPSIIEALDRLSRILRSENAYLSRQTDIALSTCLVQSDDDCVSLTIQDLILLHPSLQARVVRRAIKIVKSDLRRIQHGHLLDILDLCCQADSGKSLDLPGQIRIYKSGKILKIKKEDLPLRQIGRREKAHRHRNRKNKSSKA